MRLLLVGSDDARQRLSAELDHTSFTVAGEFATLADARGSGIEADGILLADPPSPLRRFGEAGPDDDITEALTPRERQVVELMAEGLTNKAIAARLGISDQTVKFHVASISGKLGAANRTDAVRRAVRRGLITL
jgi:DNA-binding NarL/FixJ family response regulator